MFLRDPVSGSYQMRGTTDVTLALKDSFAADHPLIQWLSAHPQAISYGTFRRTQNYRAMWAKEKQRMEEMNVAAIVPICSNNRLVAVTLISTVDHSRKNRTLSARSMNFLESTSAMFSIALNSSTRRSGTRLPISTTGGFSTNIWKKSLRCPRTIRYL